MRIQAQFHENKEQFFGNTTLDLVQNLGAR